MKARIEGLTATHDLLHDFGDRIAPERRAWIAAEFPPQHHPVVRTHPETVAKVLFVNSGFTGRIDGLPEAESAALLRHLLDRFRVPEYRYRFRCTPNAVTIWDNRSTSIIRCGLLASKAPDGACHHPRRSASLTHNRPFGGGTTFPESRRSFIAMRCLAPVRPTKPLKHCSPDPRG